MKLNRKKQRLFVAVVIGFGYLLSYTLDEKYYFLTGLFWLVFWAFDAHFDLEDGRGFLKTTRQKSILLLASVLFLMFFVPEYIRDEFIFRTIRTIFNVALNLILLFTDKDDNDDDTDEDEESETSEKVDPKNLRWLPNLN